MSINYVLIFALILIAASVAAGRYLGTARMIYLGIILSLSVFLAVIIDSGVYRLLALTGADTAIYSNQSTAVFFESAEEQDINLEELNSSIFAQTEYIESLSVPYYLRTALMENNNSRVYEYFQTENFQEYIQKFFAYIILCIVSFLVSLLITLGIVAFVFRVTGISRYIAGEKSSGKIGGVILGALFGIIIIYMLLASVLLFMDTKPGMILYSQVKASKILNYMYENNIIINIFLNIKIPVWIAGKQ